MTTVDTLLKSVFMTPFRGFVSDQRIPAKTMVYPVMFELWVKASTIANMVGNKNALNSTGVIINAGRVTTTPWDVSVDDMFIVPETLENQFETMSMRRDKFGPSLLVRLPVITPNDVGYPIGFLVNRVNFIPIDR